MAPLCSETHDVQWLVSCRHSLLLRQASEAAKWCAVNFECSSTEIPVCLKGHLVKMAKQKNLFDYGVKSTTITR